MPRHIPRSFIDELISRADITEVIGSRLPSEKSLKKRGANYEACCPFHNEKTPSFKVSPTKQIYHCFGCGKGGNVLSFLIDFDRLEFVEAVEVLAKQLNLQIPSENHNLNGIQDEKFDLQTITAKAAAFYMQMLRQPQGKKAIDYLKSRGLQKESVGGFKLGYAPPQWDSLIKALGNDKETLKALVQTGLIIMKSANRGYDRFRDRLIFPIRNRQGRIIAFGGRSLDNTEPKYLNSPDTALFHKSNELYGLYEALKKSKNQLPYLVIVEGYLDVISLVEQNLPYVAAPLGTALTIEHLNRLKRYTKKIYFCFDGDNAGQNAAWRSLQMVLMYPQNTLQCFFIKLPKTHDPDSFIRKEGLQAFEDLMNHAKSQADYFFDEIFANAVHLDEKKHACQNALEIIHKIPDALYREMLLNHLADTLNLTVEQLKHFKDGKPEVSEKEKPKEQPGKKTVSPVRILLTLLVMQPRLVSEINLEILQKQANHASIFNVIHFIKQSPQCQTTGQLLEAARGTPLEKIIQQLAAHTLVIQEPQIRETFLEVQETLARQYRDRQISWLIQKAKQKTLLPEESAILQQLLKEKANVS